MNFLMYKATCWTLMPKKYVLKTDVSHKTKKIILPQHMLSIPNNVLNIVRNHQH